MSNAKSPLFSHFSAAFNGIVSIRAYGAQQKVRVEAQRRADKYTRAATAVSAVIRFQLTRLLMFSIFLRDLLFPSSSCKLDFEFQTFTRLI